MQTSTLVGFALIAIAVITFAYEGINYTSREKVIDLGSMQMTAETKKTIPLPPIVGVVALIGGIGMLVLGRKKS